MVGLYIQNITSGYNKKPIVQNCSFQVKPKETLVLMGPSGSGKSTLLLTILGSITPFSGRILLDDQDISTIEMEKRNIGYLPQDYGLFPHMNVLENVCFGLKVRGIPKEEQNTISNQMLHLVHLQGFEQRKMSELSGGEKQRVGLARALAIKPKLLLLDEPLSNIDQVTKQEVALDLKDLFRKLEIPIILVTHNTEDTSYLAEKLAIMINGMIEQIGPLHEVRDHPQTEFIKRLIHPFAEYSAK